MEIPTIATDRLHLRPFLESDARRLHQILMEEGVLRYFPNPDPPSLDRVRQFIMKQLEHWEKHGFGRWAVHSKANDELIGWNGLQHLPKTDEIEIGFLLSKVYWGKGLATEGGKAGLKYGFETLKLERIVGIVHPENTASQGVLKKLGLVFVSEAEYFGMHVHRYVAQRHETSRD
jgi:ribosomal-protein-alanine N-acetyltransferase